MKLSKEELTKIKRLNNREWRVYLPIALVIVMFVYFENRYNPNDEFVRKVWEYGGWLTSVLLAYGLISLFAYAITPEADQEKERKRKLYNRIFAWVIFGSIITLLSVILLIQLYEIYA